ncbi:MAG: hypothetical protein O2794_02850 [bacterium]|nr:hypothetical protein [bacterium]
MREVDRLERDDFMPDEHKFFGLGGCQHMRDAYDTDDVALAISMARHLFEQNDRICGALQASLLPGPA